MNNYCTFTGQQKDWPNYNAKMTQSMTVPIYVTVSTALAALIITGIHTVVELV